MASMLIQNIKQKFLIDQSPTILLIGDDPSLISSDDFFHPISALPSPLTTLLRYHYILQAKHLWNRFDLIYYMDADLDVKQNIELNEIVPDEPNQYVVVRHFHEDICKDIHLENNPQSKAYVENIPNYYHACFYGAYKQPFDDLMVYGNEMVNQDLKKRIVAKWFDESHFNKYMTDKNVKVIPGHVYAHPERWNLDAKIIHGNSFTFE